MLAVTASLTLPAAADEVKIGVLFSFTNIGEDISPHMAQAAEFAFNEASESGLLLDGTKIVPVRGDSNCPDASAAIAAAERLINSEGVVGIVGPICSGTVVALTRAVTAQIGVPIISPPATSPAITELDDNDFTFRTSPSDGRQGVILAEYVLSRGVDTVAVTYVNDDYGKGLSDTFENAFEGLGGTVLINAAHEDGRGDYSAEAGALAASGADWLVVLGRFEGGGGGIVQSSLDAGVFEGRFVLSDGMISSDLIERVGDGLIGAFGSFPGNQSDAAAKFVEIMNAGGIEGDRPFVPQSYDAAAVLALALQAAGAPNRAAIRDNIRNVANAPGTKIYPGEIAKGLEILRDGGEIDYEGATGVEFDEHGDVGGSYLIFEAREGGFEVVATR